MRIYCRPAPVSCLRDASLTNVQDIQSSKHGPRQFLTLESSVGCSPLFTHMGGDAVYLPFKGFPAHCQVLIDKKRSEFCGDLQGRPARGIFFVLSAPLRASGCELNSVALARPHTRRRRDGSGARPILSTCSVFRCAIRSTRKERIRHEQGP